MPRLDVNFTVCKIEYQLYRLGLIVPDERRFPHDIFLISLRKHMLWVLIRSALVRHF